MTSVARVTNGNTRTTAGVIAVATIVLALLGSAYSIGNGVATTNSKLDRNCRILSTILADSRFLIIEHVRSARGAADFRRIFADASGESC